MAIDKAQAVHRVSVGLCVLALVLEILGFACPGWLLVTTDLSILSLSTSMTGFGHVSSRAGVWYVDVCVMGDSNSDCTHSSEHTSRQMGFNLSPVFNTVSRINWQAIQAVLTLALLCCCVGALFAFLGLCSTKTISAKTSTLIAAAGMMLSGIFVLPAVVLVGTALQTSKDKANAIEETTGRQFVQFDTPWALVLSAIGVVISFTCSIVLAIVTYKHEQQKDFSTPYGDLIPPAIITTGKFPADAIRIKMSIDEGVAPPVFKKVQDNADDAGDSPEEKEGTADSKPFVHPPPASKTTPEGQSKMPLLPFNTAKQTTETQTKPKENGVIKKKEMNHESNANKQILKKVDADTSTVSVDQGMFKSKIETKPPTKPSNNNEDRQLPQHKTLPNTINKTTDNKEGSVKNQASQLVANSAQNSTERINPKQNDSTNAIKVKDIPNEKKSIVLKPDKKDKIKVNAQEKEAPKHVQQNFKSIKKTDNTTANNETKTQDVQENNKQSEKSNVKNTISPQAKFVPSKSVPPKPSPPKPVPGYAKLTQSQLIKLEAKNKGSLTNTTTTADKGASQDQRSNDKDTVYQVKEKPEQRSEKRSFFSVISSPIKRIVFRNGATEITKEQSTSVGQKETEVAKRNGSKKSPVGQSSPKIKKAKHSKTKAKKKKKHSPSKTPQTSLEGAKKKKKKIRRNTKRRHHIRGKRHRQEKEQHDESEEGTDTDSSSEDENTDNNEAADMNTDNHGKAPVTIHVTECKVVETANTKAKTQPLKENVDTNSAAQVLSISNKENVKKNQKESNGNYTNNANAVGKDISTAEKGQSMKLVKNSDKGRSLTTEKANGGTELPRVSCEIDGGRPVLFDRQSSDTSSTNTTDSDTKNSDTVLTAHV